MTHCNLIIDSCCDLPFEMVDKPGITLLKFPYFFGETEYADDLFQSASAREFYDRMRGGAFPTTAQLPLSTLVETFTEVAESGVPTVYFSFSSGLSKSFDVALMARDQVLAEHPDMELHLVDTLLAQSAQGLFTLEAIKQWETGMSAQELADWAMEARYFVNVFFTLDQLESLAKGGRMPSGVAFVGSKLNLKPILYIDAEGKLEVKTAVRGRKKSLAKILSIYEEQRDMDRPDRTVVCQGGDCDETVEAVLAEVAKLDPEATLVSGQVGPTIGSHIGPGSLTFSFWGIDRRTY
ncbi:MAG: DegV family protein [Coriobacteriia bacterium]|nr:DegV family protein [Coriobacteriia bacterium]